MALLVKVDAAIDSALEAYSVTHGDKTLINQKLESLTKLKADIERRIDLASGQGGFARTNIGVVRR